MKEEKVYTIGRSRACDIILDDKMISRHHADVVYFEGRVFLIDVGSTSGTYLKKGAEYKQLKKNERVHISPTDTIRLGPCEIMVRDLLEDLRKRVIPADNQPHPHPQPEPEQKEPKNVRRIRCDYCGTPKVPNQPCPNCHKIPEAGVM